VFFFLLEIISFTGIQQEQKSPPFLHLVHSLQAHA